MLKGIVLAILFITCNFSGWAQGVSGSLYNTINLKFGFYYPDYSRFNKRPLNEISENLKGPVEVMSITLDHGRGKEGQVRYAEMGLSYFSTRKAANDSLSSNWFANNWYLIYKWDLFSNKEWIDLTGGIGPMIGSQWLVLTKNKNKELHRNFFAAVVPSFSARFQFGKRVATGIDLYYFFDFSDSLWKGRKSNAIQLNKSSFTGTQIRIFAGVVI